MHNKLPHLIYFALANNYFNVFMSTTVLLRLTSFDKIGGQWIFGGASDFSNLLAPWASGSRSLMLRAELITIHPGLHTPSLILKSSFNSNRKKIFHNRNCQIDSPLLSPFYFYVINFIQDSRTTLTIQN